MNSPPDTRASLLLRLRDSADQAAWFEFVEIYRPVIHRLAKLRGIQEADADDIAQTVLLSVAKAMEQWEHNPERARFRTWLQRVAHNAILNSITRRKPDQGTGDSGQIECLSRQPGHSTADSELLQLEYRREVFRWAARQVKSEFETATWDAFWLTTVEAQECEQVARQLGKPIGSIYAARSRVMRRLREKVAEHETGAET